ncbi:MAG: ABC transporter permease [Deltaproteobacteria bacterium]|nr:ABC transporter permease [Deltaproteobacteria bacterium]
MAFSCITLSMDYPVFIGNRYIKSKKKRTVSAITFIAIAGVALGVGALSAVLSISNGFQNEFINKVLGVNAHVLVMKYGMSFPEYRSVMEKVEKIKGVKSVEPFVIQEMMISKGSNTAGVLLKGVDPYKVGKVLDLERHIIKGSTANMRLKGSSPPGNPVHFDIGRPIKRPSHAPPNRSRLSDDENGNSGSDPKGEMDEKIVEETEKAEKNEESEKVEKTKKPVTKKTVKDSELPGIVIGKTLAENLDAKVGDVVQITTPLIGLDLIGWSPNSDAPKFLRFKISGIFYAGFLEYDTKLVFVDNYQAQRFFNQGDSVTGLELVATDMNIAKDVSMRIDKLFKDEPYRTVDWEELNAPLFTALQTQKLAFSVLLSIIVGVAAFNIIATLVMMVFDKRKEIAILKSMGASRMAILRIFMYAGTVVGTIGIAIGLVVGLGVCLMLDQIGWPLDPEVYLIDHLPVTIDWINFAAAGVVAFFICITATIIPSLAASKLKPVDGMRAD